MTPLDRNWLFLFILIAPQVVAEDYKFTFEQDGKQIAVIQVSIKDRMATATKGEEIGSFDIKQMRWQHNVSKKWVTLAECEAWAKETKEKISHDDSIPEKYRKFILWSVAPTFELQERGTTVTLKSGQEEYKMVGEKTDRNLADFHAYAKLNAYKSAMVNGGLPPLAELKAIEAMETRNLIPRYLEISRPGIPKSPTLKLRIQDVGSP